MRSAPARHATPRDPSRATDGGKVARISAALGQPLIPWQQQVADVAGEIDPETGTYYYDRVIVSVQRQAGKTTISKAEQLRNALLGPDREVWCLAQTGKDSNEQFRKLIKSVVRSPLSALIDGNPRMSNGSMALPLVNGSTLRPGSMTESAGHGFQGDFINLDEVWALSALQAKQILDGFIPTTTTRMRATGVRPQLWITSTEGTAESEYYNALLDRCRAGDIPKRWAFFDWGLDPSLDSEDLNAVARAHPGCGYLFDRKQLKDFRDQFADDPAGWRRAFCNLRDTSSTERVYPAALWAETETEQLDLSALDLDTLAFGVAVGMESESTAIAAACRRDGVTVVQIVDVLPGTAGAAERLADLQSRYGDAPIAIDRRGPSAPLADLLHSTAPDGTPEYRLSDIGNTEIVAAGVLMLDRLMQHQVLHVPDPALDAAAGVAVRRWVADSWVLSRRNSEQAINALEAAQLAVTASLHAQPAAPLQIFV